VLYDIVDIIASFVCVLSLITQCIGNLWPRQIVEDKINGTKWNFVYFTIYYKYIYILEIFSFTFKHVRLSWHTQYIMCTKKCGMPILLPETKRRGLINASRLTKLIYVKHVRCQRWVEKIELKKIHIYRTNKKKKLHQNDTTMTEMYITHTRTLLLPTCELYETLLKRFCRPFILHTSTRHVRKISNH